MINVFERSSINLWNIKILNIKHVNHIVKCACYALWIMIVANILKLLFMFFVTVPKVKPIWNEIILYINKKEKTNIAPSVSQKCFGIQDDKYLTYIFLLLKYFIYNCKFQDKPLNFDGFKALLKCNKEIKYFIAKKETKTNLLFIPNVENRFWYLKYVILKLTLNVALSFHQRVHTGYITYVYCCFVILSNVFTYLL